jgi:branched-chain amino acid transport system substrate-binding protein
MIARARKVALVVALAACSAAIAETNPILVGVSVSQSGAHAELAAGYLKALLLWQDEVNAAGGLLGRRVELRPLDDRSDAAAAGKLYRQLIREDRVDLLIGPYGSAATLMAAAEAERAQRVIVNGSGAGRALHRRAPRYLFQSAAPNAAYGAGVLELARQEGLEKLFILARDDPASREMGEAAREAASAKGFSVNELELYGTGTVDFAVLVTKALESGVEGWIAFGEARDAAEMVRTFKRTGYAPRLFFARGAADPKFIPLAGQDAEFSLGVREYDARFATPANERFVRGFMARWSAPPGTAAAQGYAAATVLAEAVRRAASLDQEKLRAALATLETGTVLGAYKVDPKTGAQTALKPAVVQIQNGRPEVVWPGAFRTAERLPYPAWSERRVLKK